MKKFKSELYYALTCYADGRKKFFQPYLEGRKLIIQYLHEKYNTNIREVIDDVGLERSIEQSRQVRGDFRQALILTHATHATFILYLKENDQSALLYCDSLGKHEVDAIDLAYRYMIDVFYVLEGRQTDTYSCYIDALVFGRDTTRVNPTTGDYDIPHLLSTLKNNRVCHGRYKPSDNRVFQVRLPIELLKTAQTESFVAAHARDEDHSKVIHKHETLAFFRERYSVKKPKQQPTYLLEKGYKYLAIIQAQYYLNEIEAELSYELPRTEKKAFIDQAKLQRSEEDLYDFADSQLGLFKAPCATEHELFFPI
ncbi:MAG: hypothetical protein ACOYKA_04155 [Legionellaceae bacterium]